jgi:branched-chain amino acid transport system substrate-binding protein
MSLRRCCLIGLVVLPWLLLASCERAPKRLVIGVAMSEPNHQAIELAARDINAQGGVRGARVELTGLEWKFLDVPEASEILKWAERFAETEDLVAVIGCSDSASTLSAAAFFNQRRIPQVVTIATSPAITKIGPWTYRLCLSDTRQGPALARYAVQQWGKKKIATFYVNDDYGRGVAQLFEEEVRRLGGTVVSSIMHRNNLQPDDQDLIRSTVERLTADGQPDLYAIFQREDAARWTIETIRSAGSRAEILGGDTLGVVGFMSDQPEAVEGIRFSQFFAPDQDNPTIMGFVRRYQEVAGDAPGYAQAFAYDAVRLVAQAAREAGLSRDDVKSYLDRIIREKRVIDGVGGRYSIGPDHDGRRDLFVAEVHDGGWRLKERLPVE